MNPLQNYTSHLKLPTLDRCPCGKHVQMTVRGLPAANYSIICDDCDRFAGASTRAETMVLWNRLCRSERASQ